MRAIVAMTDNAEQERVIPMLARMKHRGEHGTRVFPGQNLTLGCACSPDGASADARTEGGPSVRLVADAGLAARSGIGESAAAGILALLRSGDYETFGRQEGGFAFALMDGDRLLVGRDPLGVKPLYWAETDGVMVFASEMKALAGRSVPVHIFPPGNLYDSETGFRRYHTFQRPTPYAGDAEAAAVDLRNALDAAVRKRLPGSGEAGVLLSGGLDSSVVAVLARRHSDALHSFTAGTEGSEDLDHARALAGMLGLKHHECVFSAADARRALSRIIYHLESFDYPLVRSAIANDMASRMAGEHVSTVLCGEGADELFAGYENLKGLPDEDLERRLEALVYGCHNTGLQRVDRINAAHGVAGRMPFLDWPVVDLAFSLPAGMKVHGDGQVEKWIVRRAFTEDLPGDIAWRRKRKFSDGSGASGLLTAIAEDEVSDREFFAHRALRNGFVIRNKEEMLYFLLFRECFGDDPTVLDTVGITPTA